MLKKITIFIFAAYEVITCNTSTVQIQDNTEHYIKNWIISRIKEKETYSQHRWPNGKVKISKCGAIGLMQIMPAALWCHNRRTGHKFRVRDLYNETTNKIVGKEIFEWLWGLYEDLPRWERGMLATSAYNMGLKNTKRGKINYDYVSSTFYVHWGALRQKYKIVRAGTKVMRIVKRVSNRHSIYMHSQSPPKVRRGRRSK